MKCFAAALLLAMSPAAACLAQDEPAPQSHCVKCNGHGQFPCPKHGKALALETGPLVQWCSDVLTCKTCEGALHVDCKTCRNADVEAALEQRKQLAKEWLAERRKHVEGAPNVDDFLYLSTPHFDLSFSIKATTVGKKKLDTHLLMHLYGERLEALRDDFVKTFELTDDDLPDRCRVHMFRASNDQAVIGPKETGFGNARAVGLKQMGPEFVYSMWQDLRSMPDDEALHRNVVHHVTHLLLSQMKPALWLGNRKHGWIDEGLAHWFENRTSGKCTNFCFEEILMQPGAGFKGGRWQAPVRKLVDEGKAESFAALSLLNSDQLTFEQHAVAFAYVDFLITDKGGAKFRDLVRLLKQGKETREALQAVYGLNPLTMQPAFEAWVKEHYSPLPGK
ncbi:MAG: hypothetical protein R3F29_07145 [Planctomycetota bacterium]